MGPSRDEQSLTTTGAHDATSEEHVQACSECSAAAEQELVDALRDASNWVPPEPSSLPASNSVAELITFRHRLEREDDEAAAALKPVFAKPSAWWRKAIRDANSLRSAGCVRFLLGTMRELLERVPGDALQCTTFAVEIADSLSIAEYPSDFVVTLRAQALRDHAFVLSYMGRFHEALRFADRSESLFRQTPVPDYELARLDLVRASIYPFIDRGDEAVQLTERASAVFLRFGDRKRWVDARVTEGAMHFRRRDFARALAVWQSIEKEIPIAGDNARVGLIHNLGLCHRELGQLDEAARYLAAATAEFELLGQEANRVKSRWALASTVVAAGRYDEAIPMLRTAWREFETLEMEADAALVALELAEVLLVTNRRDQVPAICRTLLDRFTRAGMGERAITALAFLRETVASGHATPAHVRHVHDFLRDVPAEGERLFARPPLGSLEG